jgi:LAS superfamily LD-carboxypeptidase LdcB
MAWAHREERPKRETLLLSAFALSLIITFLAVVEISNRDKNLTDTQSKNEIVLAEPISLSCFDSSTATVQITSEETCPIGLISLGDSALLQITDSQSATTELHPVLLQRFEAAYIAAKSEGVNLYITSGFRSLSRQEVLFERAVRKYGDETEAAKWVLPAPYSHHPQGLAIDVNYPGDRPGAKWLELNGSRFGLCRVYANEWWHFEGVIAPGEACPALAPNALVDLR